MDPPDGVRQARPEPRYTLPMADLIGTSPRRKEDRRLLDGGGRYVDDVKRNGTAHLGVVRSREAHARILKIAASDALGLPGVLAVWTAADLPELARPLVSGGAERRRPYRVPVLAGELARYVGEPVAVVVAETPAAVADALAAVTVEYEALAPVPSPEAGLATETRLHEGWPDNAAVVARGEVGDPQGALAGAHVVVRETIRHARLAGAAIECRGALAYREADTGTLVVVSATQNPYRVREALSTIFGMAAEAVRVVVPDVGGGFGPKGGLYPEEILVAAATLRLGRPVKWVQTRREDLTATGQDREQAHDIAVGFARDGTIVGIDATFLADVGAYPLQGDGLTLNTVNHLPGPYRVAAYRNTGTSVVTTKAFNAAYRAAGRPEAVLVMERLVDLGARRLGLDPADVRRRNLVRPDDMPYRPGLTYKDGMPIAYDPADFPAAFERALAMLGYDEWRRRQRAARDGVRRLGIGLACYAQGTGLGPFEGATVRVDPTGKVFVFIGVTAQGQGHATTLAQIAAAELGAPLEDVEVVAGDTTLFPYGMGTGGSRVAANAGPAVARTAREVRERASRVAAELLECAPDDVRVDRGRLHVAGMPERFVTLGRAAQAAVRSKALRALGDPGLNACAYFYPDTVTWAFGMQAAVVEVDVETFAVRLLKHVIVHDPGRAINPMIVEGQLHGGAVQGIAAGLMEAVVYDEQAQLLTGSFMDYAIPRADDVPALEVELVEHPSVINELGIKGVGESGAIPGAAAIANAVEDALADLGVTVREVPVRPATLFRQARGGQ